MIREISGRGLVPKKAAASGLEAKITQAQSLMIHIVSKYETLYGKAGTLKSPGTADGKWGDNTDFSYKTILAEFNLSNKKPADIDSAIKELEEIKESIDGKISSLAKTEQAAASAKQVAPAATPADDAKAKAGFKNLLDLLQSKRLNLSAEGNKGGFKQRIERDWMAIIRAYGSTDSVVETFYQHLGLIDAEKILLAAVDEKTKFRYNYSSVLAKINNKFLETISKYIKPIGRAFRTERGIARVVNRRQTREEKRSNSLERLNILSKVAARKGVARARLEKTASSEEFDLIPYYNMIIAKLAINEFKENITKEEFLNFPGKDLFKKIMGNDIEYWVLIYDKENQFRIIRDQYNYKKAVDAFKVMVNKKISELKEKKKTNQSNSNSNTDSEKTNTSSGTPKQTSGRPTTDLATLRKLLDDAGYAPDPGPGWAPLDSAFRAAVEEFAEIGNKELDDKWRWVDVAPNVFKKTPNISGAEQLVSELIVKQEAEKQANSVQPPEAATAAPGETSIDNKAVASAGLERMFSAVLANQIRVDRQGPDLIRDTKNFKGIIDGIGGADLAAKYCVENAGFDATDLASLSEYINQDIQTLSASANKSNEMHKVYTLFMGIREEARRGVGRGRQQFTRNRLSESVKRVMREKASAAPAAADDGLSASSAIRKSIEIRKAAARKKLGL
jgi:hypothetical protein